jgi:hypothetical protein
MSSPTRSLSEKTPGPSTYGINLPLMHIYTYIIAGKSVYVGKAPPRARLLKSSAPSGATPLTDATTVRAGESPIMVKTGGPPPEQPKPYAFLQRSKVRQEELSNAHQEIPLASLTGDSSPPERPKPYAFLQRSKIRQEELSNAHQEIPLASLTGDSSPPERPKVYAFLQQSKARQAIPPASLAGSVASMTPQVRIIMSSHGKDL